MIREEINNKSSYAAIVRGDSTEQQKISTTSKNAAVRISNHNDAAKILKVHGIGTHNVGDSGEKQPTPIQAHDNMESRVSVMDCQKESDGQFKMPSYVLKQRRRNEMKKKRIVAGSSTQTDTRVRGAPEPDRHLFIFRVDANTQHR